MGYGATGGEAVGLADNAHIVAGFIRARDSGPATVVAHSWAGGVAVLLAVDHPDTVTEPGAWWGRPAPRTASTRWTTCSTSRCWVTC